MRYPWLQNTWLTIDSETVTELLPTTTQTIKYTLLNTNTLLRSSPSSAPQALGSLYLGEKVVAGINFHSVSVRLSQLSPCKLTTRRF